MVLDKTFISKGAVFLLSSAIAEAIKAVFITFMDSPIRLLSLKMGVVSRNLAIFAIAFLVLYPKMVADFIA
jgi:hypothetical protein